MANEIGYLVQIDKETKEGYKYPVSQNYLIGNSAECNFKIAEESILDLHCRIRLVDNEVHIYSLNSENPVFLNGEAVSEQGKALEDCDTIRITDSCEFEWNTTDRKIFSRSSLPVGNEPLPQENTRYSDSALTSWKRVDHPSEEQTDVDPQNELNQEKDELVIVKEASASKTESVNVSIPYESNRYSVECANKTKRSANTPIKSRKSKNPVSPFSVSNTFVSESKSNTSKILHRNDDDKEFECTTKNIAEDVFEDLVMQHASSQTAFHSTPKVVSGLKAKKTVRPSSPLLLDMNFENNSSKIKSFDDTLEKNDEFDEKSLSKISNQIEEKKTNSTSKKSASTPTKRASERFSESRRNTRGRTSLLRKTFEENSCDNENKSLTTPEKLTETNNVAESSFPVDSEIETVTETNAESKFLDESSKCGFASVSDENVTCETSFIDKYKNVVRSVPDSKNASVAKCVRNLSCISPPENNRSQEYMDSMTTTPQKNSPSVRESIADNYDVSLTSCDETSMDRSLSSARKRRSTGFTPFVGTPSNEYRVTRKMSTPFSKSILSRTSVDFESNAGPSRDGKYSSERRSTPFKAPPGKSSIRDSISCQPTIPESVSFEELEASSHEQDSTNDSKFRFITMRRGRRCGENTFAAKEKILEESELKSDGSDLENDGSFGEENSDISVSNTSAFSEADELSTDDKTETGTAKDTMELKSILTPLPKFTTCKEKSAKRVTFVLPSPECTVIKENSTLSVDESFVMISTSKPNRDSEQSPNVDSVTLEEELHVSSRQETDPSYNSLSELEDVSSFAYSTDENCDESSFNGTGARSTKIQSNLNDLSGVEQMEPSPTKSAATTDTSEQENTVKADTLSETPNFTSSFVETSNRSNLCEENCTGTRREVEPLKEIAQIAVNENLKNSRSTKISCSPGIHLSGVKSLFNTPEKLKISAVDKGIKCNLNFKASPNSRTNTRSAAAAKSFLARKSVEVTKNVASIKSSRMCKSLNLNEIVASRPESSSAKKVQTEESKVTYEVSRNETIDKKETAAKVETASEKEIAVENEAAAENETVLENEPAAQNDCNDESISNEEVTETDVTNERNFANRQPPVIIITEATFVDENANNEALELVNENPTELIEPFNADSSSIVQLEDSDKFETSEYEDESGVDRDGTLSSESSINEDGSPVLTQIRRSALPKTHSAAKVSSINDEIQPEENKSLARTSIVENEGEKEIELKSPPNTLSVKAPSESADLPTNNEINEGTENVSQSSLDVLVSDFDTSKFSDVLSTEYMGDADSSKTSINLSSCNDSQLSDFSSKDTSDLDSVKAIIGDSNSKIFDLSVNNTNDSIVLNISIAENRIVNLPSDKLVPTEGVGSVNLLENHVNRKTEIVECLSAEIVMQNDIGENQKDSSIEDICDTNLANVSQSTSSSQDMGIRIDASSALINDLHKKLEDTPQVSSGSNDEATPTETFKAIAFPESTNISSIECTTHSKAENFNKPDSTSFIKNLDDVMTPIKTALRGSSTPQSTVRRCRRSSRIHRFIPDNTMNKPSTPVHECSAILDDSSTLAEAESAKESENLQEEGADDTEFVTFEEKTTFTTQGFFDERNTSENINETSTPSKPCDSNAGTCPLTNATIEEKINTTGELSDERNTSEKMNESSIPSTHSESYSDTFSCNNATPEEKINTTQETNEPITLSETIWSTTVNLPNQASNISLPPNNTTNVILPNLTSSISLSPSKNTNVVTESNDWHTTEPEQIDPSPEITAASVSVTQQESSDVREATVETSKSAPVVDETPVQSINISIPRLTNQTTDLEETTGPTADAAQGIKKRLRNRKAQPLAPVEDSSKQGVVTRTRQRGQTPLKTTKQVERKSNEHDDKENVYSLPKVTDKSKKTDLPGKQIATVEPPAAEKKTRKPPRRLKNLENNPVDVECEETNADVFSKRSCSIVLPLLDPEITIKSPVKVDESGNISVEEPPVTAKRKRATKADTGNKKQVVPAASRTRQKQTKTVTFEVEQEKSVEVAQADEKIPPTKATTSKRNLRNQPKPGEIEVTSTRSRRTAVETQEKLKIDRTIKIQLEPVVVDEAETVEKKTRPKRGAAASKNTANANKDTTEEKAVPRKPAKRAPEPTEEIIPKRRRGKTEVTDEIPSKETAQPKNDEIIPELPRRTRIQAKPAVQEKPAPPAVSLGRSTRATKNKPVENIAIVDDTGSKKRTRDVGQSSALNDTEKSTKRTKISKNTETVEPDTKTTGKKPAKKTKITKENSSASEEPIASSSKTIPPARTTRSRKTTVLEEVQTKPATKETRVAKTKKAPVPKSSPAVSLEASDSLKKSAAVEKVKAKRAVVARSKNVSIKKGRISSTLKTSGRGSLVSRKSAIAVKPSPAKVAHEDNLVTSNLRSTRRRAK